MTIKERVNKYLSRSPWKIGTDAIFWVLIILLLIPDTRAGFLTVVSKVRTAVFQSDLKPVNGALLNGEANSWSLVDLDGKHAELGDFAGEVILLNFWATWCPPCRAEMPSLEKLYQDYGTKVRFLLVSNEDPEPLTAFMEQKKYSFPVWLNLSAPPPALKTNSIPTTFIMNKEGRIVFSKSGAFDWNSKKVRDFLDRLLSE